MSKYACHCCGEDKSHPELHVKIDELEDLIKRPLTVNSGYRCPKHNAAVGGSKTSSHLKGWAADVMVNGSRERYEIINASLMIGITRIGLYRDKAMLHLDIDPDKDQMVVWYE